MDIIKKLVETRKLRHVTQTKIAKVLGVTLTTIHRYESGERYMSLKQAVEYAKHVKLDLILVVSE
jgi:DNA-binding XRE family transcriptional regulator